MSAPRKIPAEFAKCEHLSAAYRTGWNRGHGIACDNVPKMGSRVLSDSLGRVTVSEENIREVHESVCFEAEMNGRDFSPFEFIAKAFNDLDEGAEDSPSADEAWQAYEQGVEDSIRADLATYDDEAYGIRKEEDSK